MRRLARTAPIRGCYRAAVLMVEATALWLRRPATHEVNPRNVDGHRFVDPRLHENAKFLAAAMIGFTQSAVSAGSDT